MKALRAFTLLELVVVAGLIAAFAIVAFRVLGAPESAALQTAQAGLANLVVAARTKAVATGQPARLLVGVDPASPTRYLRHIVLQTQSGGTWASFGEFTLPEGIYVLPGNFPFPEGLLSAADGAWTRTDGAPLRSTALRAANLLTVAVDGPVAEQWAALPIAAAGTTNSPGDLVVAPGRRRMPDSPEAGEAPVELLHPERVRGIAVSTYGVATPVGQRAGF
ncbi:MAG: hypothetical protein C0502_02175 [Opitutus sp.]|nr:hypothetical protein [Opitutus sp.]